jgi:hypothetical protein
MEGAGKGLAMVHVGRSARESQKKAGKETGSWIVALNQFSIIMFEGRVKL